MDRTELWRDVYLEALRVNGEPYKALQVAEEALRECPFDEPDLSPGKTVSAWRQFVEYDPNRLDWYLVTDKHGAVHHVYWNGTKFEHHAAVIAWAEEPKPYEPKP